MKKLLSILMSFVFFLTLGAVALAEEPGTTNMIGFQDVSRVDIRKEYSLLNPAMTNPAETFTFNIEKVSVTDSAYTFADMPMFAPTQYTLSFIQGEAPLTKTTMAPAITLPTYDKVGIFLYKITEAPGSTAGVIYDGKELFLKVTVIQQGDALVRVPALYWMEGDVKTKDNLFKNDYQAGNLTVKKLVTGNLGDRTKYFEVVVTFTKPAGKTVGAPITITGGSEVTNPTSFTAAEINAGTSKTFKIKHDETLTFTNVPYGVTYTVVENAAAGYLTTYLFSDTGKKIDSLTDSAEITNDKSTTVDTGISLDSLPYILLLASAVVGMGVFVIRRRRNFNA